MSFSLQLQRSPLHEAAKNGRADVVNMLITHSANLNALDVVRNL